MIAVDIHEIPDFPDYGVDREGGFWTRRPRGPLGGRRPGTLPWKRKTGRPGPDGYVKGTACYGARRGYILVHRAILETFVGPCPLGMETRHLNGNRGDNRLVNLTWGTRLDNAADREDHGTQPHGSLSPNAKLTENQVTSMRWRYAAGESTMLGMAHEFTVSFATVQRAVHGKTWAHVDAVHCPRPRGSRRPNAKLTEEDVVCIRRQYAAGETTMAEIAREYPVSPAAIWLVVHRKAWTHVEETLG